MKDNLTKDLEPEEQTEITPLVKKQVRLIDAIEVDDNKILELPEVLTKVHKTARHIARLPKLKGF